MVLNCENRDNLKKRKLKLRKAREGKCEKVSERFESNSKIGKVD